MSADRVLMLKLLGDTTSIDKSLRKTEGRLKGMSRAGLAWGKAFAMGLAIEGIEKLGDAIGDAWTGFREGEKAGAQLATTWANLGKDGDELAGVIDDISRMTLKLGTDDTEAINAYNQALKTTGGDGKAAMQRLRIAQNLVANGSAPNLSSALGIIQQAAKGSARTVDKFGLTAGTAGGRVKELGQKVRGAAKAAAEADPMRVMFNEMSEALEGVVGALSKGDMQSALASLAGIGTAAASAWAAVFPAIDKAMTGLVGAETWEKVKSTAQGALDAIAGTVERLGQIWDGLAPHVQNALNLISPLIGGIMTIVGLMGDNIRLVLDAIGALLDGDFTAAWTAVQGIVANVGTAIQTAINAVLTFLQGILPGIQEAATNIGNAIFGGIVSAIGGLADTVASIFDRAVSVLRDAWNSLDFRIPEFTLSWDGYGIDTPMGRIEIVPKGSFRVFEGTGDLIPDLAQGGIIRKRPGGMLARIGEGAHDEAVIPLDGRHGMGGNTITINVNVAPTANLAEVGREITRALKAYGQGGGMPSMKSAIGVG